MTSEEHTWFNIATAYIIPVTLTSFWSETHLKHLRLGGDEDQLTDFDVHKWVETDAFGQTQWVSNLNDKYGY